MKCPPIYGLVLFFVSIVLYAPMLQAQPDDVHFERVFPNITLEFPIGLTYADDETNYLYAPEYAGRVRVFENAPDVDTAYVFLDLRDEVNPGGASGEFYDVVFHPNYGENGFFFVYYFTPSPRRLKLARYTRSASDPRVADPASRLVLLELESPGWQNHHGGKMSFGPDGYLYLPIGDGGSPEDELGHGQNRSTLLGSVLRIDVDETSPGMNYGIPSDNPYVGNTNGWREEIWAYGFRNPYSSSFDQATGAFWVGDVGEVSWEEVNVVEAGMNYGWNVMEGPECFEGLPCDPTEYALPLYAYPHVDGNPASVIGGTVYWGQGIPELRGLYVFGDFYRKLWSLDFSNPEELEVTLLSEQFDIVAIGQDRDGELYAPKFFSGEITMLVPTIDIGAEPLPTLPGLVSTIRPNPFRLRTNAIIITQQSGYYRVALFDMIGRKVLHVFDGNLLSNQPLTVQIDAERLPAGTYMLVVEGGGGVQTSRLTHIR